MRILGIDSSTKSLAYCVMVDEKIEKYGEFFFDGGNLPSRLYDCLFKTLSLMDEFADVDYIFFEKPVEVRSRTTALSMAKTAGVLQAVLGGTGAVIVEVTPISWQTFIGNPNITGEMRRKFLLERPFLKNKSQQDQAVRKHRKDVTIDWVKKKYGITSETDNISDAIAIAYFGSQKVGEISG